MLTIGVARDVSKSLLPIILDYAMRKSALSAKASSSSSDARHDQNQDAQFELRGGNSASDLASREAQSRASAPLGCELRLDWPYGRLGSPR